MLPRAGAGAATTLRAVDIVVGVAVVGRMEGQIAIGGPATVARPMCRCALGGQRPRWTPRARLGTTRPPSSPFPGPRGGRRGRQSGGCCCVAGAGVVWHRVGRRFGRGNGGVVSCLLVVGDGPGAAPRRLAELGPACALRTLIGRAPLKRTLLDIAACLNHCTMNWRLCNIRQEQIRQSSLCNAAAPRPLNPAVIIRHFNTQYTKLLANNVPTRPSGQKYMQANTSTPTVTNRP